MAIIVSNFRLVPLTICKQRYQMLERLMVALRKASDGCVSDQCPLFLVIALTVMGRGGATQGLSFLASRCTYTITVLRYDVYATVLKWKPTPKGFHL